MRALSLAALLLLASCASPESRVRSALIDAGLSPRVATCMAGRMVDRLSTAQLRRLGGLKQAGQARSVPAFLDALRALDDPHILSVTGRAALHCAVGG
ncbi:hypothetical protein ACMT1E_12710 [Sphingomonas flavalba]|uniref:hypothetical protein n=1 Tax=Sphingomonas flavalba TaxID=2559804 RepID=UPI0039DFA691